MSDDSVKQRRDALEAEIGRLLELFELKVKS